MLYSIFKLGETIKYLLILIMTNVHLLKYSCQLISIDCSIISKENAGYIYEIRENINIKRYID